MPIQLRNEPRCTWIAAFSNELNEVIEYREVVIMKMTPVAPSISD